MFAFKYFVKTFYLCAFSYNIFSFTKRRFTRNKPFKFPALVDQSVTQLEQLVLPCWIKLEPRDRLRGVSIYNMQTHIINQSILPLYTTRLRKRTLKIEKLPIINGLSVLLTPTYEINQNAHFLP